ncbi:DUF72 domain-containing protein [Celerinatantimonas yamalensis]|uniref:DUF72 domain-containing protein n=1 Tax=Celerinatantimonas yamalensis TaxID=559956 RepID=A0ABW9G2G4_9GAMM
MMVETQAKLRLGMPMWSHQAWQYSVYQGQLASAMRLANYARVFSSVEGNTTFYALPSAITVANWRDAVDDSFRFTFKFPQTITHQSALRHCQQEVAHFFSVMAPLHNVVSQWMIQLPKHFGPESLPILAEFIAQLPNDFPIGIEVRHTEFFVKGASEQQLNRLLFDHGMDRIMMDTRPVFEAPALTQAVIEAHQRKPRLPVHAVATGMNPVIRFIGHPDLHENDQFFFPWLSKIGQWLSEGRVPHLFIHTPDNALAPELALRLFQQLREYCAVHYQLVLDPFQLPDCAAAKQLGMDLGLT